ncbi:hypothetical protein [Streptomyces sp. NBC_00079]
MINSDGERLTSRRVLNDETTPAGADRGRPDPSMTTCCGPSISTMAVPPC